MAARGWLPGRYQQKGRSDDESFSMWHSAQEHRALKSPTNTDALGKHIHAGNGMKLSTWCKDGRGREAPVRKIRKVCLIGVTKTRELQWGHIQQGCKKVKTKLSHCREGLVFRVLALDVGKPSSSPRPNHIGRCFVHLCPQLKPQPAGSCRVPGREDTWRAFPFLPSRSREHL